MAVVFRQSLGDVDLIVVNSDPSGSLNAPSGSKAIMNDGSAGPWVNNSGGGAGTSWIPEIRADGATPMNANFDMGGNDVTNIGGDSWSLDNHSARHEPGGNDALSTAGPTDTLDGSSTNTTGTGSSFARNDHTHALAAAAEGTAGVAEVATQGETDTGTDDARMVTPAKLNAYGGPFPNVTTVAGVDVDDHSARHVDGGADELDGDTLDVTLTPSNYSPDSSPAEANDVDDLAAHLAGLDNRVSTDPSSHGSRHNPDNADPVTVAAPKDNLNGGTSNAVGSDNSLARSDHTHAIDDATASTAGLMPSADKDELDNDHASAVGGSVSDNTSFSTLDSIDIPSGVVSRGNSYRVTALVEATDSGDSDTKLGVRLELDDGTNTHQLAQLDITGTNDFDPSDGEGVWVEARLLVDAGGNLQASGFVSTEGTRLEPRQDFVFGGSLDTTANLTVRIQSEWESSTSTTTATNRGLWYDLGR